jgi:cell division protease FtsH
MNIKREHQINFWYLVVVVLAVLIMQDLFTRPADVETIPYSQFERFLQEGKVADLVVGPTHIDGTYTAPDGKAQKFTTVRVDAEFAKTLDQAKVSYSGQPEPGFLQQILSWLIPTLGFFLLWMFLIRRMAIGDAGGGLMAIGKSKAKVYVEKDIKITFDDVAGVDEAKEELKEIVAFLKDPKGYSQLGAHIPKGVLLVGPPGTGKTLLARAVAGEAGVAFFSISGSEFVELFVGVGAARVRDLFAQAREHAPAIVFIDELDALGRARGALFPTGGHDEKEQTLNQLLAELDGFDPSSGVVLLGATNRPEILDPALLRAGRFDRQILVDRPDRKGRVDILNVHVRKIRLAADVTLDDIAALTPGFTGADLANLVNEAALLATRRRGQDVTYQDFTQAIERIVAGLEKKNRLLNPHERKVVAYHEMGHAIVAMALPGIDPVQKVSIIPRGIAGLGYTIQRPIGDRFLMDRGELLNRMAVLLGGRAAESLMIGEISTGAADDLAKATEIARSMVLRFGMDEKLGQVSYEPESPTFLPVPGSAAEWQPRRYGEATAAAIDGAIRALIEESFRRATAVLQNNKDLVAKSAEKLLGQETLLADDLKLIADAVQGEQPTGSAPRRLSVP